MQRVVALMTLPLACAGSLHAQQRCAARASAPALDHVVIAVRDLDRAAASFERHGFRIKPGRLHANNLLNRHVKFRDGSEIELMTVTGRAVDAMSRDYAAAISAGDGGVYLALRAASLPLVEALARRLRMSERQSVSGAWRFVSFADTSPAAAIFFSAGGGRVQDPDSIFAHEPAVTGLAEVWIEGRDGLNELLRGLGAASCGAVKAPDGRDGERWALSSGTLVVVPAPRGRRPRVLGAVLRGGSGQQQRISPLPSFWIEYRPPDG